jgi:formylglycine-generating enzyme required for sulfatase activity
MSKVFVSYRRDDSAGYAHAIYRELLQHFSKDRLFMDVDTVKPGADFVRVIEEAVGKCDVLVALIGKRWVVGEPMGTSRLDNEKDYVRLEVSTALARGIHVVPVLVDGMTMPSEDILPAPLQSLTRRNAIEISNTRFNFDVERVITAVRKILDETEAKRKADEEKKGRREQEIPSLRRKYGPVAAAVAVLLTLFGFVFWWPKPQEAPIKGASIVKPQPPQEIVPGVPERKSEAQKEIIVRVFRDRLKTGREGPEMVVIPAGSFRMGDVQGDGSKDELPVRAVRIEKLFAIGRYEATFDEYEQFVTATKRQLPDDRRWGRGRRPVINVSWQDAVNYANWLSEQAGKRYRLPSEAEWEYAARGGKEAAYWWGKDLAQGMANCNGCGSQWNGKQTAPVGSFKSNPFGLYDTAGNVWEWVEDCWHDNYKSAPADSAAWKEAGGGYCARRVIRGGSWITPGNVRSSVRYWFPAINLTYDVGFRLAQDLD